MTSGSEKLLAGFQNPHGAIVGWPAAAAVLWGWDGGQFPSQLPGACGD